MTKGNVTETLLGLPPSSPPAALLFSLREKLGLKSQAIGRSMGQRLASLSRDSEWVSEYSWQTQAITNWDPVEQAHTGSPGW